MATLQPASNRVFDLLGRPSKVRPKNTTLADFERLYAQVDDYEWYQGMFASCIQELYPKLGLQFLKELQHQCPESQRWLAVPVPRRSGSRLGRAWVVHAGGRLASIRKRRRSE